MQQSAFITNKNINRIKLKSNKNSHQTKTNQQNRVWNSDSSRIFTNPSPTPASRRGRKPSPHGAGVPCRRCSQCPAPCEQRNRSFGNLGSNEDCWHVHVAGSIDHCRSLIPINSSAQQRWIAVVKDTKNNHTTTQGKEKKKHYSTCCTKDNSSASGPR